jgi:biotin carboxylase
VAKGMGFKAAAKKAAAKAGVPVAQGQAIVAAGARKASPAAKKANPNLKKVPAKKAAGKKSY